MYSSSAFFCSKGRVKTDSCRGGGVVVEKPLQYHHQEPTEKAPSSVLKGWGRLGGGILHSERIRGTGR